MGGDGDSPPQCPTNSRPPPPQPEPSSSSASSSTRVPLVDSPILFLVCFHKAVRAELEDLRHVTSAALESGSRDRQGRGFVLRLLRRFEFLKLAYKYHCFAEDEVIFLALDGRTKNVASTYSLEHRSIDGLFDSIFNRLDDLLEESEDISKEFQELVFCVGTLQAFVCQHMLKEEELVFPLILEQFSAKEQASLVWEFLSSVPLMLLEDLLPWTISFLQPDEQDDFVLCIKEIVPDKKFLQEVVISWLARNEQTSGDENETGGAEHAGESADIKKLLKSHSPKRFFEEYRSRIKAVSIHSDIGYNLVDGLHLWHGAIRKDLTKVLEELYQLKTSSNFSDLDSIVVQLKFFVDILTFYSSALDKLFYPVLNELFDSCLYPSGEEFPNESHVEGLQRLLYCSLQNRAPLSKFVEKLCRELESFVLEINKHFAFQEIKVFPIVRKNCSHELQQQLFYVSLHILPLGLLRCMTTWFSACLSEDESKSIITSLNQGDSSVNKSFAFLLHEWFRIGRSGKTSVEKFGTDLQQIFKNRYASLSKQFSDTSGSSSASTNIQPCEGSTTRLMEPISSDKGKNSTPYPSSYSSHSARNYEKSYSTGTNPHTYFPGAMGTSRYFPESLSEENLLGTVLHEPEPIDLIFFFHKALKKDLEYLVFGSAQLDENITFLTEFCRRFHLVQFLYQIHSEAEDEVAFPALEGKGKLQNISHSYTMDHKLEDENFQKISLILEEISKLHVSVVRSDSISNRVDQKMPQHHRLCMKLHDMCKSMCKLLTEHIHREEIEIWPLFKESFSIKEQERIVGSMLGRTEAKILQDMLPWLMESLTPQEQQAMISLWRQVTRHTMFDEWLREWWEGYDPAKVVEKPNVRPSWHADPLEILSTYLCGSGEEEGSFCNRSMKFPDKVLPAKTKPFEDSEVDEKRKDSNGDQYTYTDTEHAKPYAEADKKCQEVEKATKIINSPVQLFQSSQKSKYCKCLLTLSQEDMEAAIRKISRDSSLDSQKKSYMIQNLLMSNWIVRRNSDLNVPSNGKEIPGQNPSYQDPFGLIFGCKHYKRNCKLLAACCNQLYTCIRCHDEIADHSIDRKSITEMMCMKCLQIQPVGPTCSTASCSSLSMARYFCRICKIFDDERVIYHCPYCNLCRLGKGLGIDYYHCMTCNACMSRLLLKHTCREKCFMDNCPICNEDIFTSNSAVKALPCGHLMHSICFEAYTCTNYTCPICGKSLGDMQVYFQMLDAFLAEERTPDEYSGQTQVVLCNDCEKKGTAPFHWLYHKCSSCGSYNTRLL